VYQITDPADVRFFQVRVHGQAEDVPGQTQGNRKIIEPISQAGKRGLAVQW
jgi:hypothetical protein